MTVKQLGDVLILQHRCLMSPYSPAMSPYSPAMTHLTRLREAR